MGRGERRYPWNRGCAVKSGNRKQVPFHVCTNLPPHVCHSPHIACYLHISHAQLSAAWLLHTYAQIPTVFIHFRFVSASEHLYGNHGMHWKLMLLMGALAKSPVFSWEMVILDICRLDFVFQQTLSLLLLQNKSLKKKSNTNVICYDFREIQTLLLSKEIYNNLMASSWEHY